MSAYYNEIDPYAAQWLRNLIAAGHIASGEVDERSIRDVSGSDLRGFTQCHFFAGIGGWSLALRLAGWDDGRGVWTGSCPCQPFSAAGKRKGTADDRHLWPDFARLVGDREPTTVFGEQVASADGRQWLSRVRADLEVLGYAVGAADLCAPSEGAFHIRQRLWFGASRLAHCESERRNGSGESARPTRWNESEGCGPDHGMEHAARNGRVERGAEPDGRGVTGGRGEMFAGSGVANADGRNAGAEREQRGGEHGQFKENRRVNWGAAEWIEGSDGKARPIEPGTFPLAYGVSGRVGRLRAYGNAIVPEVGAAFIEAFESCRP